MSIESRSRDEFRRLMAICAELSEMFDQGLVFIGGIAVYVHSINTPAAQALAEFTHDGDFYISLSDMADLRDIEEVTPNRRLSKSQIIKGGFEFDIYTERLCDLCVPYDAVWAHSALFAELRVAALEHLVVLKLEAYRDRKESAKGGKDARDLMRLATVVHHRTRQDQAAWDPALVAPYLNDEHLALFARLRKSPEAMSLAAGNAVEAKQMRAHLDSLLLSIESWQPPAGDEPDFPP